MGPIAGVLTQVRQRRVRFWAKNGGVCAIAARLAEKVLLRWVICSGCSVRDSVSGCQKV